MKLLLQLLVLTIIGINLSSAYCSFRINGDCFLYITTPATWYQAQYKCKVWGGNLASVRSQYESSQIARRIKYHTWIGFNDLSYEGNFEWTDGYRGTYSNWVSGQPNNYVGNEHCSEIRKFDNKWNDIHCESKFHYLCREAFTCSFRINGDCFLHITTPATWYQAQYKCELWGGNLASVQRQEENLQISRKIKGDTWIGYNNHSREGFQWSDGYKGTYSNWQPGKSNISGGKEQCGELLYHNIKSKWNDNNCEVKRNYLCRKA